MKVIDNKASTWTKEQVTRLPDAGAKGTKKNVTMMKMPVVKPEEPEKVAKPDAAKIAQPKHAREGVAAPTTELLSLKREDRHKAERASLRSTVKGVCKSILSLIADSFEDCVSEEDWYAFWSENMEEFEELYYGLLGMLRRLDPKKVSSKKGYDDLILHRFPEAAGELDFLRSLVDDSWGDIVQFLHEPISEEKRPLDAAAAHSFKYWGTVYTSCILSLDYLAHEPELKPPAGVIAVIFEQTRRAALEVNNAAMIAVALREPEVTDEIRTMPIDIADGDLVDVERDIKNFERGATA